MGELLGSHVLEQEAAGARPERVVDVLVEVERRQHETRASGSAVIRRVAAQAVQAGIRMSIRTTSGGLAADQATASSPFAGLADNLEPGLGAEDHRESTADQGLVVDDDDPQRVSWHHASRRRRSDPGQRQAGADDVPAVGRQPGIKPAAVRGDALRHAEQAMTAAATASAGARGGAPTPSSRTCRSSSLPSSSSAIRTELARACFTTFVTASCRIR